VCEWFWKGSPVSVCNSPFSCPSVASGCYSLLSDLASRETGAGALFCLKNTGEGQANQIDIDVFSGQRF